MRKVCLSLILDSVFSGFLQTAAISDTGYGVNWGKECEPGLSDPVSLREQVPAASED